MATTAEGVETRDQLNQLRAHGRPEVRGYYFSKPNRSKRFARISSVPARKEAGAPVIGIARRRRVIASFFPPPGEASAGEFV
jgi:predicted signal transduction protein with EAL and GGDEF domain